MAVELAVCQRRRKVGPVLRRPLDKFFSAVDRDGYGYSRFCDLYRDWRGRLNPTMRQAHVAGEKMFVDYAGATMDENVGAIIPH